MTDKWKKIYLWLKMEIDVEFMACTHGIVMVTVFGFLRWLVGIEDIPFLVLFEMFFMCYAIAWVQKALFLKEAELNRQEYRIRLVLYYLIPFLFMMICHRIFDWFTGVGWGIIAGFYGFMLFYFVMMWLFLKFLYQKDTEELNRLLKSRRKKKEKRREDG